MIFTVKLDKKATQFLKSCAKDAGMSVSEYASQSIELYAKILHFLAIDGKEHPDGYEYRKSERLTMTGVNWDAGWPATEVYLDGFEKAEKLRLATNNKARLSISIPKALHDFVCSVAKELHATQFAIFLDAIQCAAVFKMWQNGKDGEIKHHLDYIERNALVTDSTGKIQVIIPTGKGLDRDGIVSELQKQYETTRKLQWRMHWNIRPVRGNSGDRDKK